MPPLTGAQLRFHEIRSSETLLGARPPLPGAGPRIIFGTRSQTRLHGIVLKIRRDSFHLPLVPMGMRRTSARNPKIFQLFTSDFAVLSGTPHSTFCLSRIAIGGRAARVAASLADSQTAALRIRLRAMAPYSAVFSIPTTSSQPARCAQTGVEAVGRQPGADLQPTIDFQDAYSGDVIGRPDPEVLALAAS